MKGGSWRNPKKREQKEKKTKREKKREKKAVKGGAKESFLKKEGMTFFVWCVLLGKKRRKRIEVE